jgi:hypothetical protein
VKNPPQVIFFGGETPLATALPVLRLHVAIFDFGYGSLKTPLKGLLTLKGMLFKNGSPILGLFGGLFIDD